MGYGCAGAAEQDATPCIVRDVICESARKMGNRFEDIGAGVTGAARQGRGRD